MYARSEKHQVNMCRKFGFISCSVGDTGLPGECGVLFRVLWFSALVIIPPLNLSRAILLLWCTLGLTNQEINTTSITHSGMILDPFLHWTLHKEVYYYKYCYYSSHVSSVTSPLKLYYFQ